MTELAMTSHVYLRLMGFQLTVVPRAPFRIQRSDEPLNGLDVEHDSPLGPLFARLIPRDGGYASKLDEHTKSLFDVLDVTAGPNLEDWQLETSVFACAWPDEYAICSNNFPNDPAPFDLIGPNGEMIYVQTPAHIPDLEAMRTPDQAIQQLQRTSDSEWIELAYQHDGQPWCQRHEVITVLGRRLAVTTQAPSQYFELAVRSSQEVVRSFSPGFDQS